MSQKLKQKSIKEQTQAFAVDQSVKSLFQAQMPSTFANEKDLKADDPLAFGAHLDGLGMGIEDVDELVGVKKADHQMAGIVDVIMEQNRKAEKD